MGRQARIRGQQRPLLPLGQVPWAAPQSQEGDLRPLQSATRSRGRRRPGVCPGRPFSAQPLFSWESETRWSLSKDIPRGQWPERHPALAVCGWTPESALGCKTFGPLLAWHSPWAVAGCYWTFNCRPLSQVCKPPPSLSSTLPASTGSPCEWRILNLVPSMETAVRP